MASTWVLKFPQVDKPQQPILVHVTQKHGVPTDLDLLATDGEEAYRGKLRQRNISKLKSKNFEGTEEEWTSLLHYTLVSKRDSEASEAHTKNLEVDCSIAGKGAKAILSITLRSRIEDITHKLGVIELTYSENTDDVDLFGWAVQLADQRDDIERQRMTKDNEVENAKGIISNLEKQLTNLVKAKDEHEDQLLSKFALLLNEKKTKIRNQQRILQTAKVNKKTLDALQVSVSGDQLEATSSKRKRDEVKDDQDEDDESDGFDAMDVDEQPDDEGQEDGGAGQDTPPRSASVETATASEDDAPSAPPTKPVDIPKSKAVEGKARAASPPPPPRTLPFQKKGQKAEASKEKPASAVPGEDEETASEDDEL